MRTRALCSALTASVLGAGLVGAQQPGVGEGARSIELLPGLVVEVEAGEFFFRAADTVPAGLTTFRLRQVGMVVDAARAGATGRALILHKEDATGGMHTMSVVRLDSGRTVGDLYRAAQAADHFPAWITRLGGPGFTAPPRTANATFDLEPGHYALVCYTGSAQDDRTRYHFLKGMYRTLTVVAAAGPRITPRIPDVIVRIADNGALTFSRPIPVGRSVIRVDNRSSRTYEFKLQRMPASLTGTEFLADPSIGPGIPWGGLAEVPPGRAVTTTIDFEPGHYVAGTRVAIRHATSLPFVVAPAKP